jgi:hypothetical protein
VRGRRSVFTSGEGAVCWRELLSTSLPSFAHREKGGMRDERTFIFNLIHFYMNLGPEVTSRKVPDDPSATSRYRAATVRE